MYCTDVKVKADFIETLFINAWNHLVGHPEEIKTSEDALKDYRTGELKRLLAEYGKIDEIRPELVRQTLDHICINENGEADVIFLCRVTFKDGYTQTQLKTFIVSSEKKVKNQNRLLRQIMRSLKCSN